MLKGIGIDIDLKYIGGYEESDAIRPGHYELWFIPGEPEEMIR